MAHGTREKIQAAEDAALEWLATVDAGDYEQSWHAAASLLRKAITAEQFARSLEASVGSYGALISRKKTESSYATSLPGAPDGEYVQIQYKTVFEKKLQAQEIAIVAREADGTWRVVSYNIQ